MAQMLQSIRETATAAGRDGREIKLVVRGNVHMTEQPLEERFPFVGSWEQVLADIEETRGMGADELFLDPQGTGPEEFLGLMERVKAVVK